LILSANVRWKCFQSECLSLPYWQWFWRLTLNGSQNYPFNFPPITRSWE
jgi:hypothetical protein